MFDILIREKCNRENSRILSVDIDFVAVKNADGLANYLNLSEHLCGIVANFLCLPFDSSIMDVVCTHY